MENITFLPKPSAEKEASLKNSIPFSCSTMWNIRSHENSANALLEMAEMGFEQAELNYLVSEEALGQMMPVLEKDIIAVSSVHNVFPRTLEKAYGTDSPLLGYADKDKRRESLRLTRQSIDYAHRLGAKAVVLHVSEVTLDRDYHSILSVLYRNGQRHSPEYQRTLQQFQTERQRIAPPVLAAVIDSLTELSDYITQKGYSVQLGIENRAQIQQIPTFDEMEALLQALTGMPCGFWYDIGHGILMESYGLFTVFPAIQRLQQHIIGMHLHDASGIEDHFYPYAFGDAFDQYLPFIKASPVKVFEIGPKCSREEVTQSLHKVRKRLSASKAGGPM